MAQVCSQGHPAHVSSLSGPGKPWYAASYTETTTRGCSHLPPPSCCLSAAAVRFLAVLSRHGLGPSLRSACRSRSTLRTVTGFPRSTQLSNGRCRVSPIPRGHGAHTPRTATPGRHRRIPTAGPKRQSGSPSPALEITRLPPGIQLRSPSRPSPCLFPMDGTPGLGRFPGLHTPPRGVHARRMPRWGQASSTSLET